MSWRWALLGFLGLIAWAAGCGSNEEWVGLLHSSNPVVRLAAASEIARLAAPTGMRGRLASLLQGSVDERVIEALIQRLADPAPEVRVRAARALGNLKSRQAIPRLQETLKDEVLEVRREAASSLGKILDPRAIPALASALDDPDLRLTVIWALGNIGDGEAVPLLLPLVESRDRYVRYSAMQALKKLH